MAVVPVSVCLRLYFAAAVLATMSRWYATDLQKSQVVDIKQNTNYSSIKEIHQSVRKTDGLFRKSPASQVITHCWQGSSNSKTPRLSKCRIPLHFPQKKETGWALKPNPLRFNFSFGSTLYTVTRLNRE
jgi:hypothetical protein